MSSHHIVREKQEPALLVLGLENFDEEQLGQLLEWSPTVITTPDTAEKLNSFGIKIDWIIGNSDSSELQSDVKFISAGNDSMAVAALNFLVANNYPAVNVITDEVAADVYLAYAVKINLVVFNKSQKIYAITSGFSKWKPTGEQIKLLSMPKALLYKGLKNTGQCIYTTTRDGFFKLQFEDKLLLIAEDLSQI